MKKKLLSLVLAGAMVASTSVSAFAKTIDDSDAKEVDTEVSITGNVLNDNGDTPAGNFNITIPTAAAFTVSSNGGVVSMPITIENHGEQNIDVYAKEFRDTTPQEDAKITVVAESALKSKNRTNVSLNIQGNMKTLFLKSTETGNGIYKEATLATNASGEDLKIANIAGNQNGKVTISGKAGETGDVADSVSDQFTLVLKIKKSSK